MATNLGFDQSPQLKAFTKLDIPRSQLIQMSHIPNDNTWAPRSSDTVILEFIGEIPMFDGWIMWKIPIFASLIPILRRSLMGFWKRSRRPGRPAGAVRKDASGEAVFPRYQMMLMITYDTYIYNMCIYINMYIYIYIY